MFRIWDGHRLIYFEDIIDFLKRGVDIDIDLDNIRSMPALGIKDINRREVYDGDILRLRIVTDNREAEVIVVAKAGHPLEIEGNPQVIEIEIIGNIYETPDLIPKEVMLNG